MILLAEDDLNDAMKTRAALRAAGVWLPVTRTIDGVATIAYLKGEGAFADRESHPFPSVLLLDLKMPRAHGFQVLDWIRQNLKPGELLVIALSGLQEQHAIQLAYDMGAQSFLTKPCLVEDIRNLMKMHSRYWHATPPRAGLPTAQLDRPTAVSRGGTPVAMGHDVVEIGSGRLQGTGHDNG